jgi:nucleotide-binding universal stress UspA family protein
MFAKILVALDLSEHSQEVFNKSLSLAQKYEAELLLIHVLSAEEETSPIPIPVNLDEIYPAMGNELTIELWQEQWEAFEKRGLDVLRARTQEAQESGVQSSFEQILGSPGKTICKIAKDRAADIIVVGHRGRWGLSEILLGSVSNYVFHHAPCSVLVVPTSDG